MKLLKLDSSLSARKQLAKELGYEGKLTGSAEMNIWLHEKVMTRLADGGGVVPSPGRDGVLGEARCRPGDHGPTDGN